MYQPMPLIELRVHREFTIVSQIQYSFCIFYSERYVLRFGLTKPVKRDRCVWIRASIFLLSRSNIPQIHVYDITKEQIVKNVNENGTERVPILWGQFFCCNCHLKGYDWLTTSDQSQPSDLVKRTHLKCLLRLFFSIFWKWRWSF